MAALCLAASADVDWDTYNGPRSGTHFSTLTQIDRANVAQLQPVWTHDLGETQARFECSPIVVGRTLYGFTPSLKVIALDAVTGEARWTFDSGIKGAGPIRGVTYWREGGESRLLVGIMNYLYALDPATGRVIDSFGRHGRVDLREGLQGDPLRHFVALTSPGVLYRNLIVVGFRTGESAVGAPGAIRALDVRSGKVVWTFHTIPRAGEPGSETWPAGQRKVIAGANSWAGMVVDEARGIVFAPTGSAGPDFHGKDRLGANLFANSLLALDALSGRRLWHYQTVHHDLWDRDLSSPPVLVRIRRDGHEIDSIAQPTKQGYLFVFDRVTGVPVFPIEEVSRPPSTVPGEQAWPTQPRPALPLPFARENLTEEMLTRRTPEARRAALEQFRSLRNAGPFAPLGLNSQTIVFPGFDGGAEWGGPAYDPQTHVLYVNSNDIAWSGGLERVQKSADPIIALYQQRCLACHGPDRRGAPPSFPSLIGVTDRMAARDAERVVSEGRGRMPAFADIAGNDLQGVIRYASSGSSAQTGARSGDEMVVPSNSRSQDGVYEFTGYRRLVDSEGYPAVAPPWGTLSAIDLDTGEYRWQIPLGEYPELATRGGVPTGTENYGGPLLTAGGVLFIGASIYDRKLRAFDSSSGKLLWQFTMPYAGNATPITYSVDGRQYIVIATSNSRNRSATQGSSYMAFALPGSYSGD